MAIGSPQWMYSSGSYELEQSLRFNDDDSAYLSWTPSSNGNRKTWTFSCWVKGGKYADSQTILSTGQNYDAIRYQSTGELLVYLGNGSSNVATSMLFRDPSSWYHIICAVDTTQATESNRIKIYINGEQVTEFSSSQYPALNYDTGFSSSSYALAIGRRQSSSNLYYDGYLAELNFLDGVVGTPADFGETGTYGEWKPKEYSGSYGTNGFYLPFKQDYTVEGFSTVIYKGNSVADHYIGGTGFKPSLTWLKHRNHTTAHQHNLFDVVRGTHKTLHSNSTEAEEHLTNMLSSFAPDGVTLGTSDAINDSGFNYVAWNWDMGADTPTGFSAVTYKGNGGTQNISGYGFSPDLVWIKSRSSADSHNLQDAVRGADEVLFSNLTNAEGAAGRVSSFSTDGFNLTSNTGGNGSGKSFVAWGWDMGGTSASNTSGTINSTVRANPTYGQSIVSYTGNGSDGATVGHGLSSAPDMVIVKSRDSVHSWSVGHVGLGTNEVLLLDQTSAKANCTTDFSSGGVGARGATTFTLEAGTLNANNVNTNNEGFIAYCFHSVSGYSKFGSYSGTGSTGNAITTGFRPAFVMIKCTTNAAEWIIVDSTRNPTNPVDKQLFPDVSDAEVTSSSIQFDSNGFTLLAGYGNINNASRSYIYMAFAGGMDSISDYNTDGSIDSRVKANPTYGQSIVSYVGTGSATTVGHGLSSAPDLIIVKNRDYAQDWAVYDSVNGSGYFLRLNATNARQATTTAWNNDATSSVFGVGNWTATNKSGDNHIAYCFHSVTGYSKIGSYTGSGSSGNSVTTGFRPAFLLVKNSNDAEHWRMYDNVRDSDNVANHGLIPSNSDAENSDSYFTFDSNGFTVTVGDNPVNGNGDTIIYMAFADKREYAYWLDQSGNNNDWTSNNLTESDISVDSPTNNFATLNPLTNYQNRTISEGNLRIDTGDDTWDNVFATFGVASGKWYWETLLKASGGSGTEFVGISEASENISTYTGSTANSYGYLNNGNKYNNGSSSYGASWTTGDVIGTALDMDAGTLTFYKNNASQGQAYSGLSGTFAPTLSILKPASDEVANFGQDSSFAGNKVAQGNQDGNDIGDFYYTPPTGFLALCTKNLPDVAVTPSEHFNTVLYTGTGITNRAITGVGFQPDLVWAKARNNAQNHTLFNSISGVTKYLNSNTTTAESTNSETLLSFDSDGYTLGNAFTNESAYTYAAWNWKAGTSVSGNTTGSGTAQSYTGSVNTDSGFSIIKYTGNGTDGMQVPHHLGVVPDAIFIKSLTSQSWNCFFPNARGADKGLQLDNTGAEGGPFSSTHLSDEMPTTSVVKLGNGAATNTYADGVGQDYIMYCWANKDGYSSIGSYTGNGNADGTFVYTGFRPAFVICKMVTDAGEGWIMRDNARDPFNVVENHLNANQSYADSNSSLVYADFLSNGFKQRANNSINNGSGKTYIYIAFAETPFKYSNAR